jgi:hypothetical protein
VGECVEIFLFLLSLLQLLVLEILFADRLTRHMKTGSVIK